MSEGSLYDRELAALAIKQARGDLVEAIFLLRAYRTTLPRFGASCRSTRPRCRSTDASRRRSRICPAVRSSGPPSTTRTGSWTSSLRVRANGTPRPGEPRRRRGPCRRGDSVARSAAAGRRPARLRGAHRERAARRRDRPGGGSHAASRSRFPAAARRATAEPRAGRRGLPPGAGLRDPAGLRAITTPSPGRSASGDVDGGARSPRSWDSPIAIGEITVTECQMVNQFSGSATAPPQFTRGYGLAFGHAERKAMAMALVDRALARRRARRDTDVADAGRGVRPLPQRQRRGVGLRPAPEAAAPRGLPVRAGPAAHAARRASTRSPSR